MKVNGSQVAPAELEGLLLDHPDIADVCVVGIPDEFSGEVPLAYVVIAANTLERVKSDAQALNKLKANIMQVSTSNNLQLIVSEAHSPLPLSVCG